MSTTHVPATPENVAAAIADLNAPLPVGARRMTEAERQLHVSNVLEALFKQSKVSVKCLHLCLSIFVGEQGGRWCTGG